MIARTIKTADDSTTLIIGFKKSEIDSMLATGQCAVVNRPDGKAVMLVYVVDGSDLNVEEEFLRVIALNSQEEPT